MANRLPMASAKETIAILFANLGIVRIVVVDDNYRSIIEVEEIIVLVRKLPQQSVIDLFARFDVELPSDESMEQRIRDFWDTISNEQKEQIKSLVLEHSNNSGNKPILVPVGTHVPSPSGDDSVVSGQLEQLFDSHVELHLLSLSEWKSRVDDFLQPEYAASTLFLFDRDFSREGGREEEGFELIRKVEEVPCARYGMLTHTVDADNEFMLWDSICTERQVDRNRFLIIAKARLTGEEPDYQGFVSMLRLTILSHHCNKLKEEVWSLFQSSVESAQIEVSKLSVHDFDKIIFRSSRVEGIWEVETLFRVFADFHRFQARARMYANTNIPVIVSQVRTESELAEQDENQISLYEMAKQAINVQRIEMYDPAELLNTYCLPIDIGDIFADYGDKKYILLSQPCDLMIRKNGKRRFFMDDRVCVPLLELVETGPDRSDQKEKYDELKYFDEGSANSLWVDFHKVHHIQLFVVDLCAINTDGVAKFTRGQPTPASLCTSWKNRFRYINNKCEQIFVLSEDIGKGRGFSNRVSALKNPVVSNTGRFKGEVKDNFIQFNLKRICRLKQPYAGVTLTKYNQYHSRVAFEHELPTDSND